MALNPDFKEFLGSLNENQVRYLVAGAYAVALHGYPRYSKDLDIWIEIDPKNAARVVAALEQFGYSALELTAADFLRPDISIHLGYPPKRIVLWTTWTGADFEKCFESRTFTHIDDIPVNFVELDSLKRNRPAVEQPQDLADLDILL